MPLCPTQSKVLPALCPKLRTDTMLPCDPVQNTYYRKWMDGYILTSHLQRTLFFPFCFESCKLICPAIKHDAQIGNSTWMAHSDYIDWYLGQTGTLHFSTVMMKVLYPSHLYQQHPCNNQANMACKANNVKICPCSQNKASDPDLILKLSFTLALQDPEGSTDRIEWKPLPISM